MKRLMIMAAGTGGHIFPGLAIAETMKARGWQVTWLGTTHGMECDIVPKHGIEMDTIEFKGLRGKGLAHTLRGAFRLAPSFANCFRILARRRPDVVLGMGGYVTVPGGVMAKMRGVPLVLVNADAALLLSNKTLAPLAKRVLFGFPADFGRAAGKATVTGNPVRKEILELANPAERYAAHSGPLRILVVGGSLGAQALNACVPLALAAIAAGIASDRHASIGQAAHRRAAGRVCRGQGRRRSGRFHRRHGAPLCGSGPGDLPCRRHHRGGIDGSRCRQRAGAVHGLDHHASARQRALDGASSGGNPFAAKRIERRAIGGLVGQNDARSVLQDGRGGI